MYKNATESKEEELAAYRARWTTGNHNLNTTYKNTYLDEKKVIDSILSWWFRPAEWDRNTNSEAFFQNTFNGGKAADDYIRKHYGSLVEQVLRGEKEHWKQDKDGLLAYVLICDQFTRNLFRKTAKAFSGDPLSIKAANSAVNGPNWS